MTVTVRPAAPPRDLAPAATSVQTASEGPNWVPTRALGRAVLFCGSAIIVGVFLGRLDLIVIAAPFAIGAAVGLRRRPTRAPVVAVEMEQETASEGEEVSIGLEMSNVDDTRLDLVVGRLTTSGWLDSRGRAAGDGTDPRDGLRPYAGDVGPGETARVDLRAIATHWGPQQVGPAVAYGVAGDGLLVSGFAVAKGMMLRVHPAVPPFRAGETMPRLTALVGIHRSRRPGEGGELAGVRRYGPGDRLRRIDWRVTLRTGELHVTHTFSDRDAQVVVLLDVVYESGRSGGIRSTASIVDTTVRAAAAITDHYLRQGDRVGLVEYSGTPRYLRASSGGRHLHTALDWLLETRFNPHAADAPVFGIDHQLIPNAALVVVLTPLLGPRSAEMIATLARAGRSVVAVDTLGALAQRPVDGSRWTAIAQRLWRAERENLVGLLREAGVPVTVWAGTGSLDQVLQDMARMAEAPRLGVR
ncbi:MAG TPA: DUF58 domain-containing protein [Micromonosporaceae bacterium]|jgi:uncharacterized protein (DUF58 family)